MTSETLLAGLRRSLPELSPSHLYDDEGSRLFEQITEQPEYYQTRTELSILEARSADIVAAVNPTRLAELGSGAGRKVGLLFRELSHAHVTMLDINEDFCRACVNDLAARHPEHTFEPLVGNFLHDLHLLGPGGGPRMVLFFAGTLGNLKPDQVPPFMAKIEQILAPEDAFLVGVDLVKDRQRLHDAYNDAAGVTAAFNLNSLKVINARYEANFDVTGWEHRAFYSEENAWIEMRLRAKRPMRVIVAGEELHFAAGDEIRTEVSCKYTRQSLAARLGGLRIAEWFTDPEELFALALVRR